MPQIYFLTFKWDESQQLYNLLTYSLIIHVTKRCRFNVKDEIIDHLFGMVGCPESSHAVCSVVGESYFVVWICSILAAEYYQLLGMRMAKSRRVISTITNYVLLLLERVIFPLKSPTPPPTYVFSFFFLYVRSVRTNFHALPLIPFTEGVNCQPLEILQLLELNLKSSQSSSIF